MEGKTDKGEGKGREGNGNKQFFMTLNVRI